MIWDGTVVSVVSAVDTLQAHTASLLQPLTSDFHRLLTASGGSLWESDSPECSLGKHTGIFLLRIPLQMNHVGIYFL